MRWPTPSDVARALRWLVGLLHDKTTGDASSARALAFVFGIVGCIVALRNPSEAATVAALVSGGAVALMSRK